MTAIYDRVGIRFLYPQGWKVTDDDATAEPRNVALESPTGGTWELIVYTGLRDRAELAAEALKAMQAEYENIEVAERTVHFADVEAIGYELYFYHLDLLVSSRVFAAHFGDRTVLLLWQAEDREFDNLEPVFVAIATSLLNPDKFTPPD